MRAKPRVRRWRRSGPLEATGLLGDSREVADVGGVGGALPLGVALDHLVPQAAQAHRPPRAPSP